MSSHITGYCSSCGNAIRYYDKSCSYCGALISTKAIAKDDIFTDNPFSLIIAIIRMAVIRRKSRIDSDTTGADTFLLNRNYCSKSKYKQNLAKDLFIHCDLDQLNLLRIHKKQQKEEDPFNITLELEIEAINIAINLRELAVKKDMGEAPISE